MPIGPLDSTVPPGREWPARETRGFNDPRMRGILGDHAEAPSDATEKEAMAALVRSMLGARGIGVTVFSSDRVWSAVDADEPALADALGATLSGLRDGAGADPAPSADPSAPVVVVRAVEHAGEKPVVAVAVSHEPRDLRPKIEAAFATISALALRLADGARELSALRRTTATLARFEAMSKTGRWHLDLKSGVLTWSDEVYRIFGREPGAPPTFEEALGCYPQDARTTLRNHIDEAIRTGKGFTLTLPIETRPGEHKFVRPMAEVDQVDGVTVAVFGVVQDVTEEKEAERRLWWTANHDPMTGLPNRMLFHDRLTRAIEHAKRFDEEIGLVILDVDNFKMVNDVYGHEAGDRLLSHISDILLDTMRATDSIARLGGDEFAVILGDLRKIGDIHPPLERLREATDFTFDYRGTRMPVRLSMGVALFPGHGETGDDLYRNADIALFRTKTNRDNRLTVYESRFGYELQARDELLHEVRQALDQGLIVPFYQPQFDLESGAIVGAEVLARWIKPDRIVEAAAFLSAIDDYEMAPLIGEHIIRQAAADMAAYKAEFHDATPFSLNISRSQVRNPELLSLMATQLNEEDVSYRDFIVEISEDAIVERDHIQIGDRLRELAARGLSFSFDDFGTGFSSLIHINAYSVGQVKIDRQLVEDIHFDPQKLAVIDGILRICSSLAIDVVAECVELEEQVEVLRRLGVRHAQGNLLARPMTFSDFQTFNRSHARSGFIVSEDVSSQLGHAERPQ